MTIKTGNVTLVMICIAAAVIFGFVVSAPKTVDTSVSGEYTAELLAVSEPDWPFGSQEGRLVLKKNGWTVCEQDFTLHNDGKNMGSSNWSVAWDGEKAAVTIMGEEQSDALYYMYYTGVAVRSPKKENRSCT
ncbi:MAG: hypothetical protein J6O50_16280 [Ruminiclostridium sp.]|nr:hypothetical protein [Ruminiclostridium sp.]